MKGKQFVSVVCIVLTLTLPLLSACGTPSGKSSFPTGTFVCESAPFKTEWRDDGTYTSWMDGQEMASGTYSVEGNELTYESDSYCDSLGAGKATYTWTFKDDTLTFEVKGEDECSDRMGTLHLVSWHKEP